MPEFLGTDLVKFLTQTPFVIFTTAHEDYAVESFELQAVDYLLKPFAFEQFLTAINKAKEIPKNVGNTKIHLKKEYLTIKTYHKRYKVQYSHIRSIEDSGNMRHLIPRQQGSQLNVVKTFRGKSSFQNFYRPPQILHY